MVYVREAHASDEWVTPDNPKSGISVAQPTTDAERCHVAAYACSELDVPFPAVADGVDDAVGIAYGAWPDRLYVVDETGVIAYRGGIGPFGFKPEAVGEVLRRWRSVAP